MLTYDWGRQEDRGVLAGAGIGLCNAEGRLCARVVEIVAYTYDDKAFVEVSALRDGIRVVDERSRVRRGCVRRKFVGDAS